MTPGEERHYVGGIVVGVYNLPRPGEVRISDPILRDVMTAVGGVANWSKRWPVDVGDVADTLLVVFEHDDPIRLLNDLILDWDRVDSRARELAPLLLLVRALDAATVAERDATDELGDALDRRAAARARVEALTNLLPSRAT